MLCKDGVRFSGVVPEILRAMALTDDLMVSRGFGSCVVTSVTDGVHGQGSLHFKGRAFDFRSRDLGDADVEELVLELGELLGSRFDVVKEVDHVHVEFARRL